MVECAGCRVRHIKCDADADDTCSSCRKAGRQCVRGYNIRFRNLVCPTSRITREDYGKYEFIFEPDQVWPEPERAARFVDSADGTANPDGSTVSGSHLTASPPSPFDPTTKFAGQQSVSSTSEPGTWEARSGHLEPDSGSPIHAKIAHDQRLALGFIVNEAAIVSSAFDDSPSYGNNPHAKSANHFDQEIVIKKVASLKEAKLVHHFITHLAPWYDCGDSSRHFAKIAPILAATSPVLLNAILALAAIQSNHLDGAHHKCMDAVHYHDRCIELMVPLLDDADRVKDDALLLTSTILVLYEDLDYGADSQRHIFGTSLFLPAQDACLSSPLQRAAFWIYLRQEIYVACSRQRPVSTDLDRCGFDISILPENDDGWVHRILWICAKVTQWAFGDDLSSDSWRDLKSMVEDWKRREPDAFSPIFFRERDPKASRWFPEACYATDEHVTGNQFCILAEILLITHDPAIPRVGLRMKRAMTAMRDEAMKKVRLLCGQGIHNDYVPAGFLAGLAIRMCASFFDDPDERVRLVDFLRDTSRRSGWPAEKACETLYEEWGWPKG